MFDNEVPCGIDFELDVINADVGLNGRVDLGCIDKCLARLSTYGRNGSNVAIDAGVITDLDFFIFGKAEYLPPCRSKIRRNDEVLRTFDIRLHQCMFLLLRASVNISFDSG
ncbi:hypothetical protein D3C81_1198790 [compost metagenome]